MGSEIQQKKALQLLAKELGVRRSWHEPDEQDVTVEVRGKSFDNCGTWGLEYEANRLKGGEANPSHLEMYVIIRKGSRVMGQVNLATLLSWACGYEDEEDE